MRLDCDGDALLLLVRQEGPGACHTGYRSCFYRKLVRGRWIATGARGFDPRKVYKK
jgi:phosphoribosyl-AMP cyclohydrolase